MHASCVIFCKTPGAGLALDLNENVYDEAIEADTVVAHRITLVAKGRLPTPRRPTASATPRRAARP